jgi:hypothetical protein
VKGITSTVSRGTVIWAKLTLIFMVISTIKLIHRALVCGCLRHLLLLVTLPREVVVVVVVATVLWPLTFPPIQFVALSLWMWLTVLGYRKQLLITAEINTITVGLSSWK